MILVSFRAHPFIATLSQHVARRAYSTPVPNVNKVWDDVDGAVQAVRSGDTLLSGGTPCYNCARPCDVDSSPAKGLVCVEHRVGLGHLYPLHCSSPISDTLIQALSRRKDVQTLTAVSNNAGVGERGLGSTSTAFHSAHAHDALLPGLLLSTRQIDKMIASYIGGLAASFRTTAQTRLRCH